MKLQKVILPTSSHCVVLSIVVSRRCATMSVKMCMRFAEVMHKELSGPFNIVYEFLELLVQEFPFVLFPIDFSA